MATQAPASTTTFTIPTGAFRRAAKAIRPHLDHPDSCRPVLASVRIRTKGQEGTGKVRLEATDAYSYIAVDLPVPDLLGEPLDLIVPGRPFMALRKTNDPEVRIAVTGEEFTIADQVSTVRLAGVDGTFPSLQQYVKRLIESAPPEIPDGIRMNPHLLTRLAGLPEGYDLCLRFAGPNDPVFARLHDGYALYQVLLMPVAHGGLPAPVWSPW